MAKNKTTETESSVAEYLNAITDEKRRKDCAGVIEIMQKATGFEPKMWGAAIVGFGSYHYKYDSGHEGDAPLAGLASRSNAIALYLADDAGNKELMLKKLGKHKTGKGCVYIQKLADVEEIVLGEMAANSVNYLTAKYQDAK